MKAKEYFEKYFSLEHNDITLITKLLKEMVQEALHIAEKRNIKQISSVEACFVEQQQKLDSINNLYLKKYGTKIFIENGFIEFCRVNFPAYKKYIE